MRNEKFNQAEEAAVKAVEKAAKQVEAVAKFEVKVHPVTMAWNYGKTTFTNGSSEANAELLGRIKEQIRVDVGLGKDLFNTDLKMVEFTDWLDVALCQIESARLRLPNLASTVATSRKRAVGGIVSAQNGDDPCVTQKFKQIASPAYFNITDPNEKIGATLAKLAQMLVPVEAEQSVASAAIKGLYHLAFPGEEEAQILGKNAAGKAEHLTAEEWPKLKQMLKDEEWSAQNCGPYEPPAARRGLRRRGFGKWFACTSPKTLDTSAEDASIPQTPFDTADPSGAIPVRNQAAASASQPDPVAIHNLRSKWHGASIPEEDVLEGADAPQLVVRSDATADKAQLLADLKSTNTAALKWSKDASDIYSSKDLFAQLRRIFVPQTKEDEELKELAYVVEQDYGKRLRISSTEWQNDPQSNPTMEKLRLWTQAVLAQGKETLRVLKGLTADDVDKMNADIDFYWIAKGEGATNPDLRGLHYDSGTLQFGAADQPGLIIRKDDTLFRVPTLSEAWHLIKCSGWAESREEMTEHTVFGPDIVENGRVSLIVNIVQAQ